MKTVKLLGARPGLRILPVGSFGVLQEAALLAGLEAPLRRIDSMERASESPDAIDILDVPLDEAFPKGRVSAPAGRHAFEVLRASTNACLRLSGAVLVTCPVSKESLEAAGRGGRGHTEILAELAGAPRVETVFCIRHLKIFFLTRHLPLREAIEEVKKEKVLQALVRMDRSMKELGCGRPRLAVAGLNPHCGDGGLFGREEIDEILPAVAEALRFGIDVRGPIGADSVFHLGLEGRYDAVLSLYHDQGHVAAKTRDFFRTVTLSLGLPFLRTSVDHGTAFDIAWKGVANPESLVRAVELAAELIGERQRL